MRIVVAPDAYKGSASAADVAAAMARGIRRVIPDAEIRELPVADGGEGTLDALLAATRGERRCAQVHDPLGRPIAAPWGILGDGQTAVIEMAAASGLPLLAPQERNPRITGSRGTGELIRAALDAGMRRIVLGIGGSATNDGGAGMARALGARFLDHDGKALPEGGAALAHLARIDLSALDPRLHETEITVACDVDNPLCGPRGASAIFGPQKGATPAMVDELDAALLRFADFAEDLTDRVISDQAGAGAAGGLGAGLMFFTPAILKPGIDLVLDVIGFDETIANADLLITGEGRTEAHTAFGKAPVGVARRAKRFGVPVICLSGSLGEGADDVLGCGIDALASISDGPMTLEESMSAAPRLIESASARLGRLILVAGRTQRQ